jgi:hypothetical protein
MYSNVYGAEGVKYLIDLMKRELIDDAGNLGIVDVGNVTADAVRSLPIWDVSGLTSTGTAQPQLPEAIY